MDTIARVQATQTQPYRLTFDDVNAIDGRHPLERVAFRLCGDEFLWYLLADVNVVRDPADWSVGETIQIPQDSPSILILARKV